MKSKLLLALLVVAILFPCHAQQQGKAVKGIETIRESDLKSDVFAMADPHFNGRSGGTLDELKASAWFAEKMRSAGLKPAGDDGTYFQFFSILRSKVSSSSSVSIGGHSLALWKDVLITQPVAVNLTAPLTYLGEAGKTDLSNADVKGKAVVLKTSAEGINMKISLPEWRYFRSIQLKYGNDLIAKGAVAVIFIADEYAEHSWPYGEENFKRGAYSIEGNQNVPVSQVPVVWMHSSATAWMKAESQLLALSIQLDNFTYPSVNIIAKSDGTDPVLSKEYVLLSGHPDAHGIRNVIGNDSIYHGADDNASVNAAMLEVAKALKQFPGKRSSLLVIHGSEERGLLGSRYFAAHPTVPISSIVAVLNGDMIGRNNPDSAALLGTQRPHMNSSELVKMATDANQEGPKFKLDTLWDKPSHKEGWYFRSDHLPYARLGIPALMYSTLLHADYHTPQDNAANINYQKLLRMTQWIYRTARKVVDTEKRPAPEPNFKLER